MKVNNMKELLEARGLGEKDFGDLKRNTYKYTDCGAWIVEEDNGVSVGSIVEGVDGGATPVTLTYPFDHGDLWDALESIERECNEIWMQTHGCEDCYPDEADGRVNPECKTCEGEGVVI